MERRKRLYIIGIDSAPLWIIEKFYKKYKMDGFGQFIKDGVLMDMASTLPPLTPVAWPSIYTGLEPREHGMMDFFSIDRHYTKQLLYFDSERNTTFWDLLARRGLRSLVVTPPVVLQLSRESNVDMITGWPLPPRFSSGELESAAKRFGFNGEAAIEQELQNGKITLGEAVRRYGASIRSRAELSKHLIEDNGHDLAFVCFTETDRMQHYSLNNREWEQYVLPLYKDISDFIEWVIDHANRGGGQYAIMLVSDHGAQPIHLKFLLNAWLINSGYAALKPGIVKQYDKAGLGGGQSRLSMKYALREMLLKSKARKLVYDKLPASAKRLTGRIIGGALTAGSGGAYTRIHDFDFDMAKTLAFTSVSNDPVGMIWINDRRFSRPSVGTADKAKLKSKLISELSKLKTENGKKLVAAVYDGGKYYRNTRHFIAPDILLAVREGYMVDVKNYSMANAFMEPELAKSGDHTSNGIFGLLPRIYRPGRNMDVYGVKPMVMRFFGAEGGRI